MRKVLIPIVCAAGLTSPAAMAGVSGNIGATSDYMFRGITQTAGPAIQGGIDYEHDSGFYAGTWVSNIGFGGALGGTEQDFYMGFAKDLGPVGLDGSLIYYWYPEESELGPGADKLSTVEVGLSVSFGPVSLSYNYADETNFFIGDGLAKSAGYLALGLELPLSESLSFSAGIGQYSGDEIQRVLGTEDKYMDYSLGLGKELEGGYSVSFMYSMTDLEVATFGFDDGPKFIASFSKSFDL